MFKINTGVSALKFNVLSEHAQQVMFHVRHVCMRRYFHQVTSTVKKALTVFCRLSTA